MSTYPTLACAYLLAAQELSENGFQFLDVTVVGVQADNNIHATHVS
jgi:hypothetical protein